MHKEVIETPINSNFLILGMGKYGLEKGSDNPQPGSGWDPTITQIPDVCSPLVFVV